MLFFWSNKSMMTLNFRAPGRQLRLFDIRLRQTKIHAFGWKKESSESQSALINQAWTTDGFYITSGSADPMVHIVGIRYNARKPSQSVRAHKKRVFTAVRFEVHKDCLPLPESSFRHAISDNNQRHSKLNPELNNRQVRNLISLFSPFAGSSPAPVPPLWPNVAPSWAMPPPAVEDRFQPLARLPPQNDLYVAEIPNDHAPPMLEPQQRILTSQHDWYGTDSNVDHVYPAIERQGLPAPNDPYYSAEAQQPFLPDDRVPPVQDPYYSYHRYNTMQEITPRDPCDRYIGLESEYHQVVLQMGEGSFPTVGECCRIQFSQLACNLTCSTCTITGPSIWKTWIGTGKCTYLILLFLCRGHSNLQLTDGLRRGCLELALRI